MPGGGILGLVAVGPQDTYLSGDPTVTFFKSSYSRHSPYSSETKNLTVQGGSMNFNSSNPITIDRSGDLISDIWLNMTLTMDTSNGSDFKACWQKNIGYRVIQSVNFEIGGTKIDEMFGNWLIVWHELSLNEDHASGWDKMMGNSDAANKLDWVNKTQDDKEVTVYVPLQFYFNTYTGLAIPLIALQYHDVKVTIKLREGSQCIVHDTHDVSGNEVSVTPRVKSFRVVGTYHYLGDMERKAMAQHDHQYLITQNQSPGGQDQGTQTTSNSLLFDLGMLNHPVKVLVWTATLDKFKTGLFYGNDAESATKGYIVAKWWVETVSQDSSTDSSADTDLQQSYQAWVATEPESKQGPLSSVYVPDGDVAGIKDLWNKMYVPNPLPVDQLSDDLTGDDNLNADYPGTVKLNADNIFGANIDGSGSIVKQGRIIANGTNLFENEPGMFFNSVVPSNRNLNSPEDDSVYVFSFALKPGDYQPSGTTNFSRIDNAKLNLDFNTNVGVSKGVTVCAYAVNYNVLKITAGMGGLMFSN